MGYVRVRHSPACVAFLLCASMIFGMLILGAGSGQAASDNSVFKGTVKIGATPAPDTLVMYSLDSQNAPMGNSTVSSVSGNYEIWVEGGHMYYLYFANGGAMFDNAAQLPSNIMPGQTKVVNATLNPAPARTVTLKGFVTNSTNSSQPVTVGHILGLRSNMGGDPDYINWTSANATGYYELMVLPGMVFCAVFDAPGYFPSIGSSGPLIAGAGQTLWVNISLTPLTGFNVNITGYVRDGVSTSAIEGATVSASMQDVGFSRSNTTNVLGYYDLSYVEGSGRMDASAPNYVSQRMENVDFSGDMSVDFYLNPTDATLSGFVVDSFTGLPIPNATVRASTGLGPNLNQYNETQADSSGYYSVHVCGGDWFVSARAPGYSDAGTNVVLSPGDAVSQNVSLIPENGVIKGFLTDWTTGLPIESATFMITSSMSGRNNATITDSTGYFEVNCLPDEYEVTFVATGYMWEVSQLSDIIVGTNETVWMNHTLDPATVHLFGLVDDAVTGAPIDGAAITVASYAPHNTGFIRIAQTTSIGGNYSLMVAWDTSFTVIMADHTSYDSSQEFTSIPDVADFEHNISMIPSVLTSFYTLEGVVTDSSTDAALPNAYVRAMFGSSQVDSTTANATGVYKLSLPVLNLTIEVSSAGYVMKEVPAAAGAESSTVWLNVSLDPHDEPPILNMSLVPNVSVSVHNPANISVDIVEPYLSVVRLSFMQVTKTVGDTVWVMEMDTLNSVVMYGLLLGEMQGEQLSPGHWSASVPEWDSTSQNLVMLTDDAGNWTTSSDYGTTMTGYTIVWGRYVNSSMMGSSPTVAYFDLAGAFLGVDTGSGFPDPGTAVDPTGEFWIVRTGLELNLTDGTIMSYLSMDSPHILAASMQVSMPPIVYPSGDYVAIISAQDQPQNDNYTFKQLSIDNDPPVADAVSMNQTQIVGLSVTLDASGSTDNVGIANYTWVIEDGAPHTLWGAVVDYVFTTTGNHTVTVTVKDSAGYSSSTGTWVEVVPDQSPVAVAGSDQVVDEDTTVSFNGYGSSDDVAVANFTWTIVGTSTVMYGPTPSHVFATPGVFHVSLVVKDTIGQPSAADEAIVTVLDVTAPMADAGPDQSINSGSTCTFDGSGSMDNVGIVNYTWSFTDGGAKKIYGVAPTHLFASAGTFVVTLNVSDLSGLYSTDTVTITVVTDTQDPVADAGADKDVKAGATVTFDGTGSTDNVGLVNYTWTFVYDGETKKFYSSSPTFTFQKAGDYTVTLEVRDAAGNTGTDTVVVHVASKSTGSTMMYVGAGVLVVAVILIALALLMRNRGDDGKQVHKDEAEELEDGKDPPPPPDGEEL